jgi:hypothetical protein
METEAPLVQLDSVSQEDNTELLSGLLMPVGAPWSKSCNCISDSCDETIFRARIGKRGETVFVFFRIPLGQISPAGAQPAAADKLEFTGPPARVP